MMIFSKSDFPILKEKVHGKRLIYLDSAATSLKPKIVIKAMDDYYLKYSANIHRGIYSLSEKATEEYEKVRILVKDFIRANSEKEIIFTKNSTEAINLVAFSLGGKFKKGDQIITTITEHHSNFLPWQRLAQKKGLKLLILNIGQEGQLDLEQFKQLLSSKTKLIALSHVSNVLGLINPIQQICKLAHKYESLVLVDGAQTIPHLRVDVQKLGCDFYVFSSHKMLGPTGVGVLYAKEKILSEMEPFILGGGMFKADIPQKFEAGTPDIGGVIGLGAAISCLNKIGIEKIEKYEKKLVKYLMESLKQIPGITIYGPRDEKLRTSLATFSLDGIHPHDLASILDLEGIAIRAGHHCCMPLHEYLQVAATVRVSLYFYNSKEDIDSLISGIQKAQKILRKK